MEYLVSIDLTKNMMKQYILILILNVLIFFSGKAQETDSIFIQGQVISKDKCPLPGVLVQVVDSKIGAVTDIDGLFSFKSPIEGILRFSFLSEPIYLSQCDFITDDLYSDLKFAFRWDSKQKQDCKKVKPIGRIVKLDSDRTGTYLFINVASYKTDIKRITLKHYKNYINQGKEVIVFVDGELLSNETNIEELDYVNFESAYIVETTPNKRMFFIVRKKK